MLHIFNPRVGGELQQFNCVSVCVCVCVLLLISDTTRFGATVKQCVERSCYDILNLCADFRKTS